MNGSYYSEDDDEFPSLSPSQENSTYSSKGKKKKRSKRSTIAKKSKKNSTTTTDTNNFLKDINNILDDKDTSVLQNPKSSRMSLSINRNIGQTNIINHTTNTNATGPTRGNMRHSIINTNTNHSSTVKHGPSTIQTSNTSRSRSRNSSDDDDDEGSNDDEFPSQQALAMRDKFRQERLAKEAQHTQQHGRSGTTSQPPEALSDRRSTARERLRTTVLNIKSSRPSTIGIAPGGSSSTRPQPDTHTRNHNPSMKRFSVAPAPSPSSSSNSAQVANKRFSVAQPSSNQAKGGVVQNKNKDTRLQVSDIYSSSSSSDNDSDYYDSSSESDSDSDDYDDDDDSSDVDSEDFDLQDLEEESLEESIVTVIDPKVEESKADPLVYDMLMLGDGGVGKTALLTNFISDSFSPEYNSTRGINQHHSTLYMGQKTMLDRGKLKKRHVHVKLNIWDIGSRLTKHSYIKNSYILNSIIVFVVYDVTNLESYMSAIETIRRVRQIQYDQMIVLVGNKADNSTVAADDDDFDSDEDEANVVVVAPPQTGLRRLSMIGTRRGSVIPSDDYYNGGRHAQPGAVLREIAKREAALEALRLGALFFETSAKTGHNVYILFNEVAKILVHKRRKLLFKIEAGIKKMQDENDEHSSDFESDTESDDDDLSDDDLSEEGKSLDIDEDEEGKAQRLQERKEKRKEERRRRKEEEEAENSSEDDDSVLSAMSDWSDEDDDSDDDYVDVYGWGGKKKTEKADCTIM